MTIDPSLGFLNVVNCLIARLMTWTARHATRHLFALPSESRTERLIEQYFSETGELFPILHKSEFLDDWARTKEIGSIMMRRTWLGVLNMVLAVANIT
jgi:hypothetical protein